MGNEELQSSQTFKVYSYTINGTVGSIFFIDINFN